MFFKFVNDDDDDDDDDCITGDDNATNAEQQVLGVTISIGTTRLIIKVMINTENILLDNNVEVIVGTTILPPLPQPTKHILFLLLPILGRIRLPLLLLLLLFDDDDDLLTSIVQRIKQLILSFRSSFILFAFRWTVGNVFRCEYSRSVLF